MPEYRFVTEETVIHSHSESIVLPVDMGSATIRLTDRMARTLADNKAVNGMGEDEKVTAVFRDTDDGEVQIWPTSHSKKQKAKPVDPAQRALDEINENIANAESMITEESE